MARKSSGKVKVIGGHAGHLSGGKKMKMGEKAVATGLKKGGSKR
jgi:hypothetical protein